MTETITFLSQSKLAIFSIMFTPTPPALIIKSQVMAHVIEIARTLA